jgi:uncharacterized membrane protein YbhN (UPF0104 family)
VRIPAKLKTLLKVVGSLVLVVFAYSRLPDLSQLLDTSAWQRSWFFWGVLLATMALPVQALRWMLLHRASGVKDVPFRHYLRYIAIGYGFNLFLPSSIGGDVAKSLALGRRAGGAGAALSSVFIARLFGVHALFALFWLGIVFEPNVLPFAWLTPLIVLHGVFLVATLLLASSNSLAFSLTGRLPKKLKSLLLSRSAELRQMLRTPKVWGQTLLLSILLQGMNAGVHLLFYWGVGAALGVYENLIFAPLIVLATMLPVSLGGVGMREMASVSLLTLLPQIQELQCLQVSVLGHLLVVYFAMLGTGLYGLHLWELRRLKSDNLGLSTSASPSGSTEPATRGERP